jgi:hypothetical protein
MERGEEPYLPGFVAIERDGGGERRGEEVVGGPGARRVEGDGRGGVSGSAGVWGAVPVGWLGQERKRRRWSTARADL